MSDDSAQPSSHNLNQQPAHIQTTSTSTFVSRFGSEGYPSTHTSDATSNIANSTPSSPTIRKRKRSDTSDTSSSASISEMQLVPGGQSGSMTDSDDHMDVKDTGGSGDSDMNSRYGGHVASRPMRDSTYYFEDGSCVLLVHDTLFNVHRTLLSRDNSSFGTMFTLPQGSSEAEGRSDDNPIVLHGDKPSEFRHFLWALYALPPELRLLNSAGADLTLLIDIARISNKYSFKSLETWSLDQIQEYVNRKPSPLFSPTLNGTETSLVTNPGPDSNSVPGLENSAQLTKLIQLSQLCGHERLLNTMIGLLRQLMTKSIQYAYLAMSLADELDLRALRGAAYMEVMQKATVVRRTSGLLNEGDLDEDGRLIISPAQQLRLLTGYWHLTRTWERLRGSPPPFVHATACGATWHQHGCTQSWVEFWKDKTKGDAVLSLGLADVMGRLKQVQKDYDRWGSATYMHHDCRLAARRSIADVIKKVDDRLPDYFSDEVDEADVSA